MPPHEQPDDDLVRAVVRSLVAEGMPRDAAIRLELRLRDEYGGRRYDVKSGPRRVEGVVIQRDRSGLNAR